MNEREYIGEVFDYVIKFVKYDGSRYLSLHHDGIVSFLANNVDGESRATSDAIPFHNIKSWKPEYTCMTFRMDKERGLYITVYNEGAIYVTHDLQEARTFFMDTYVLDEIPVLSNIYYY